MKIKIKKLGENRYKTKNKCRTREKSWFCLGKSDFRAEDYNVNSPPVH
jgi:hypothetical protein